MHRTLGTWAIVACWGIACGGAGSPAAVEDVPADTGQEVADASLPDLPATDETPVEDTVAVPGQFGAPCLENRDCDDGFCVEGAQGFFCTKMCLADCPGGWLCRTVPVGADLLSLCLPEGAELCRPCQVDTQCGDGLCLVQGTSSFCAKDCTVKPCPTGYRCEDVATAEGTARQCLPELGTCDCSEAAAGAQRACFNANEHGSCLGISTCDPATGWSGCDAPAPAPESCNARDDDCDGLADGPGIAGCKAHYRDADQDGFGDDAQTQCLCDPVEGFTTAEGGDCDEADKGVYPGAPETCNGRDDDCDGQTDEGVQSPCGNCDVVCTLGVGQGTDEPFDADAGNSQGLRPAQDGSLVLDSERVDLPFLWIANSGENTVSKVNTRTACEVARYGVCTDPSRTAVDQQGNGIITCRGDGKVAKVAIFTTDCSDRNGNGQIDTSRDQDGDCRITPDEMEPNDECVLWQTAPDPASKLARAAGVDRDDNLWVGFHDTQKLVKLNGGNGAVMQTIPLQEKPYGLAIDQQGTIWVVAREPAPQRLVKVDPVAGRVAHFESPSGYVYGMAIDPFGKIWVASGEADGVHRFDPITSKWTHSFAWPSRGDTRGVAVSVNRDASGTITSSRVFVAHNTFNCQSLAESRKVSVVDASGATELPSIDLGGFKGPVGVAIDFDGMLWTVNMCEGGDTDDWPGSASKVDPATGKVLATVPVGERPYTYSDMTGYALKTITAPQGHYRHLFSGWEQYPTSWHLIYVDADLPGAGKTWAKVRFRALDTPGQSQAVAWKGPFGPYPPGVFPVDIQDVAGEVIGHHLEVEVILGTDQPDLVPTLRSVRAMGSAM